MKRQFAAVAAVLALVVASSGAVAEQKSQKGKGPAGPQVRYFDLSSSVFSELGAEAILKEIRQGTTLTAAELEICHQVAPGSNRLDRFVVPLKVEGNRLTGSGQSQEGKQAVSVNLTRRAAGGNFNFEGTITAGSITEKVRSTDNAEMTEEEITDQFLAEPAIEAAPDDFTAAWPQALHARVGRSALTSLLDALRDQNVRLVYNSLLPSCRVLRSGNYSVQIDIDAERAGAVMAKVKSVSGVAEVGFSPNTPNMGRAVRFPSAGWRDGGGKLERDKLAAAVAAAMAKAMGATVGATTWDPVMGELSIELKRPDESVAGLKLSQIITVSTVVAPESLTNNQQSILWIESINSRIADERSPPRLTFTTNQGDEGGEGQNSEPEGSDALPDAVATALKGKTWDSDSDQWRK
ncbi:MAG: hypothetical protein K2Y71_04605 [Xanthobacteraceae bacterium]|nr:hypothetical protein [Xanthobacteraceae bacterium]